MQALYKIPVWDTIATSWKKVRGTKAAIWVIYFLIFAIVVSSSIFSFFIPNSLSFLWSIAIYITIFLLKIGLFNIGIQRAFDLPVHFSQAFKPFDPLLALNIIVLYLFLVIIFIPITLLIVFPSFIFMTIIKITLSPGLLSFLSTVLFIAGLLIAFYLTMRMWLSMAFVIDKGANPWQAIKLSFQASRGNFIELLLIFFIQIAILILSLIPLGIGLIWSLPFVFVLYGVIYKRLSVNVLTNE